MPLGIWFGRSRRSTRFTVNQGCRNSCLVQLSFSIFPEANAGLSVSVCSFAAVAGPFFRRSGYDAKKKPLVLPLDYPFIPPSFSALPETGSSLLMGGARRFATNCLSPLFNGQ